MLRRGTHGVLVVVLALVHGLVPLVGDDLDKARAALVAGLSKIAKQVVGGTKDSVVAMLKVRCDAETDPLVASCDHVQVALQQALLASSVYAFRAESERPLSVEYTKGVLPKGVLFTNDDLAQWRDKQLAEFLIDPRIKTSGGKVALLLTVFDLKKGGVVQQHAQPLPKPDAVDYAKVCELGLLPTFNQEILLFAFSRVGQQVRTGECTELPADPMLRLGRKVGFGVQGAYKFGKRIEWKDALPGDVLSTSNHVMVLTRASSGESGSSIVHQNTQGKRYVFLDYIRSHLVGKITVWRPGATDE